MNFVASTASDAMHQRAYRKQSQELCKHISWSGLYEHRRAAAARFGKIFALPIAKRVREVLLDHIANDNHVLEVGAGSRDMQRTLQQHGRRVRYESIDIDPNGEHEYASLEEIERTYDVIFALEVVEHLTLEEIKPWLVRLHELLRANGTLLLSTPNTYYPPAYLRDATHRTPLCYDELAGLCTAAGFEVTRIVRIYHDPLHRKLLRRYLFGWLFRLIGIDFARQIMLVARRPATADAP